ncbi:MAG: ketopantoate reductase family protein, partial [Candidatus Acidiferrales bacterium]
RICIVGCGSIGSLYAAHLARVAEVWAFVRREEHARALNESGLRVTGVGTGLSRPSCSPRDFTSQLKAATDPAKLPKFNFGIVATKALQTAEGIAPVANLFPEGAVLSAMNGLGGEEVIASHTRGYVMRGTTFMSGSRVSDTHVKMELDTATWMGPYEPTSTPFALVEELAELIKAGGLKAEALRDARPAQWSKLIFNASVNSVSALTDLPHCNEFAEEANFGDLGRLLHDLIDEGKRVAAALGITLHEDPWEMNKIGAQTDHPPSMLYDVQLKLRTEVDFLGGAIAHEAARAGVPAPLHTALYRLIKGKELSWK